MFGSVVVQLGEELYNVFYLEQNFQYPLELIQNFLNWSAAAKLFPVGAGLFSLVWLPIQLVIQAEYVWSPSLGPFSH